MLPRRPASTLGGKRKLSHPPDSSPPDSLLKRQRRLSSSRSHSRSPSYLSRPSLSDSEGDEDDAGPSTPSFLDDNMDWSPDAATPAVASDLSPNQIIASPTPQGRDSSPSGDAIHHLQLLREARPPVVVAYAAPFHTAPTHVREPPAAKVAPMKVDVRPDAYLFAVELPGYTPEGITVSCKRGNVVTIVADIWHLSRECLQHWDITFDGDVDTAGIRASMNPATHVLTLTATRFRRFIPIEYQVRYNKPLTPMRPMALKGNLPP